MADHSNVSLWTSLGIQKTFGGKAKVQFENNFVESIYLGPTTRTEDIIVGTDRGVLRSRRLKRLANEQRLDRVCWDTVDACSE